MFISVIKMAIIKINPINSSLQLPSSKGNHRTDHQQARLSKKGKDLQIYQVNKDKISTDRTKTGVQEHKIIIAPDPPDMVEEADQAGVAEEAVDVEDNFADIFFNNRGLN